MVKVYTRTGVCISANYSFTVEGNMNVNGENS
jgi:hypothetical protein